MTDQESTQIKSFANNLTTIFLSYGTYNEDIVEAIISNGIQIAIETLECRRNNRLEHIKEKYSKIFNKQYPKVINGDIDFYFSFCRYLGEQIANGTPEKVDEMFGHAHRLNTSTNE